MDTSKEYVKMCEKSREIQAIATTKEGNWFYVSFEDESWIKCQGHFEQEIQKEDLRASGYGGTECIWLPRQDQLQEMIIPSIYKYYFDAEGFFNEFIIEFPRSSAEILWLMFVMQEKFDKTWNGEDWCFNGFFGDEKEKAKK